MFAFQSGIIRKQWLLFLLVTYAAVHILGAGFLFKTSSGAEAYRAESFAFFFMAEVAVLLFIVPLLAVYRMDSEMHGSTIAQFASAQINVVTIGSKIFGFSLLIAALLCMISGLTSMMVRKIFSGIPPVDVLRASLLLLPIAAFALSVGFCCSIICRSAFSAAGLALLILILISTQPVWFGPILNLAPDSPVLIQSSLLINPFVGVASALKFDILRTNPLYHICPIGQLRFQYPSGWSVASYHLLLALLIFWRTASGIRRMAVPTA